MDRKRVLVCEGDRTLVCIFERVLGQGGFTVRAAENSADAYAVIKDEQPAVAIMDLEMGRHDGLLGRLEREDLPRPRVVAVLQDERAGTRELARAAGAEIIFVKPLNMEEVLQCVEELAASGHERP